MGTVVNGALHRLRQHPGIAFAVQVQHPVRQDFRLRCRQRDQPGHMRAVAVPEIGRGANFGRNGVIIDKVVPRQQLARQRRMRRINAGIEHRHLDACAFGEGVRERQPHCRGSPLRKVVGGGADGPRLIFSRLRTLLRGVRFHQ